MGRHSAPDGEDVELSAPGFAGVAPSAGSVEPAPADPYSGTRGDMHLLRESPSLRARCAAAVLVPFLVYTIVLIVIGRTDVYLIWLWLPTVLAGVLVGVFLDSAHRRLRTRGPESAAAVAAAATFVTVGEFVAADEFIAAEEAAEPTGPNDADALDADADAPDDEPAVVKDPEVGLDIVAGPDGSVDEH